jgi:hypothetical protein
MNKSTTGTKISLPKKFTHAAGRLCRIASRQVRLAAVRRQRKHYFRNLGERLYVFKVLQREEDVWEREEISQLLLSLADLDQEQELLLQEINEIRNECRGEDESVGAPAGTMPAAEVHPKTDVKESAPSPAEPATETSAAAGDEKAP